MRASIGMLLVLAACSNLGPFRAHGDDDDSDGGDGGVTTDGRAVDGAPGDGTQLVTPMKLADAPSMPSLFAVAAGYVYWSQLGDSKIGRVAKSGGAVQATAAGGVALSLETRDGDVYWVASDAIRHASDGDFTAGTPLVSSTDLESPLAVSADDVYFFEDGIGVGNDELHKVARGGGSPQLLRSNLGGPRTLAIDGTTLYVAQGLTLEKSTLASPASTSQVAAVSTGRIAAAGGRVCWVSQPDSNVSAHEVWCAYMGGKQKIATASQAIMGLAMSASAVYWIPQDTSGSTEVWSHSFATNQNLQIWFPPTGFVVIGVAVDASALYWLTTNDTTGEVWKQPL
jgi:hypothetical protein